jgi:hypothetical protein
MSAKNSILLAALFAVGPVWAQEVAAPNEVEEVAAPEEVEEVAAPEEVEEVAAPEEAPSAEPPAAAPQSPAEKPRPKQGRVLYTGFDPGVALSQSAAAAKVPLDSLRATTLRELMTSKAPVLKGDGVVLTCEGIPSTMKNVRGAVQRAENAVAYMEFANARAHLRTALMALSCLQEPLAPDAASRIYYLEGVVQHAEGNPKITRSSFKIARTFDPELAWDNYFPPGSKEIFDEVLAQEVSGQGASLQIIPAPAAGTLWVDGQPATGSLTKLDLSPGIHAIQVVTSRAHTAYVDLENGAAATLVMPSSVPDAAINWVADPATQPQFNAVLEAALPLETPVYVVTGGQVWQGQVGQAEWAALKIPSQVRAGSSINRRDIASKSMLWGGGGVAALSGAYAGISWLRAMDAYRTGANAETYPVNFEAEGRFDTAAVQYRVGMSVALGSALIAGGGWLLKEDRLQPVSFAGGGHGLLWSWAY